MFRIISQYFRERRARRASRRGLFYFELHETRVVCDPLLTYCDLRDIGFDTLDEQLTGLKQGEPAKTRAFVDAIKRAFGVKELLTAVDYAELYRAFLRYLFALKKNLSLLRDFAPDLEARLVKLSETFNDALASPTEKSRSVAPSTESKAPPTSDSRVITAEAAPSTDSD